MKESSERSLATYVMSRRADIEEEMARHFCRERGLEPTPEDEYASRRLVDVLVEVLCGRSESIAADALSSVSTSYFTKFGDVLIPILKDVLADEASPTLLSTSIDGYWRALREHRLPE